MRRVTQSPTDPAFVQNPYPVYADWRSGGHLVFWEDYGMAAATSHAAVQLFLRDRRFGREVPPELRTTPPPHLIPFYAVEDHSMLELEPPRHTRLRGLVLRAFTSRKINELGPDLDVLCEDLLRDLPTGPFDLLPQFAVKLPVLVIARLLGVPDDICDQLLDWSHAMVAMYQARRDRAVEDAAAAAARDFSAYLSDYIDTRRAAPADDLISHLIAAEEAGETLTRAELISTCILLLNAGHEATVHTIGNGVKALLEARKRVTPETAETAAEEILRYDTPLHMFTRYAYEEAELFGHTFRRGEQVALLLGAANRDPKVWENPDRFDPTRHIQPNSAFGAGRHFCVGAPLARLELQVALPALFRHAPKLRLAEPPVYADTYHFHGLERLMVRV